MRLPVLHWSILKRMAQSPAHLLHAYMHPTEPTAAMRFGTLVHALVLGGDVVVYEGERRGNAWRDFAEAHEGRTIVTAKERDAAARVADAVLASTVAAPLLVGERERAWQASLYGRRCGGRIDVAGAAATVELKTTNDAEPYRFQRACLRMGYAAQLAWYQDARRELGEDPGEAFIVGVETKAPYPVTVLRVTPRALDGGRKLNRLWVERLEACEASDEWPGYAQSVLDLDVVEDAGLIIDGEELTEAL